MSHDSILSSRSALPLFLFAAAGAGGLRPGGLGGMTATRPMTGSKAQMWKMESGRGLATSQEDAVMLVSVETLSLQECLAATPQRIGTPLLKQNKDLVAVLVAKMAHVTTSPTVLQWIDPHYEIQAGRYQRWDGAMGLGARGSRIQLWLAACPPSSSALHHRIAQHPGQHGMFVSPGRGRSVRCPDADAKLGLESEPTLWRLYSWS